jgi:hypothetical protein
VLLKLNSPDEVEIHHIYSVGIVHRQTEIPTGCLKDTKCAILFCHTIGDIIEVDIFDYICWHQSITMVLLSAINHIQTI